MKFFPLHSILKRMVKRRRNKMLTVLPYLDKYKSKIMPRHPWLTSLWEDDILLLVAASDGTNGNRRTRLEPSKRSRKWIAKRRWQNGLKSNPSQQLWQRATRNARSEHEGREWAYNSTWANDRGTRQSSSTLICRQSTRNEERGSRETKVRKRVSVQQVRERVDDEGDKVSRRSSAARMDPW